ncbi:hypothetical protein OAI90_08785 [Crocinitomicaceae bacterium]|nr:hypothetical protein [Crocinitomicaceae bacterium]
MTERAFYKKAYQLIFKEGQTHQQVYDEHVKESQLGPETVARSISIVPSKAKNDSLKPFWMAFIVLVIAMAGLRLMILFQYNQIADGTVWNLIFSGLVIVIVPLFGIHAALSGKAYSYTGASFFSMIAMVRGFFSDDFGTDTAHCIFLGMAVVLFVLGGLISRRLRAGYTKNLIDHEKEDGKIVKRITYSFDDAKKMTRKEFFKETY